MRISDWSSDVCSSDLHSIRPGFSRADGSANETLLAGLDFAMAEIAKRGMTAVLVLGNFWEWSGGFSTWLYRATGRYVDANDPAHPWPAFADSSAGFPPNAGSGALYPAHFRPLLVPRNSITGRRVAAAP